MFISKYIVVLVALFLITFSACDDTISTKNEICNNAADDDGDGLIDCDDPDCSDWSGCKVNSNNTNNTNNINCGNGEIDSGEECDGSNLNSFSCESLSFDSGSLSCNQCLFDTTNCVESLCGNGVVDLEEECDGDNLNGSACVDFGYTGGTLACESCQFDFSHCEEVIVPECGDGLINGTEECDTDNLNGETCISRGFISGVLSCDTNCNFDETQCVEEEPNVAPVISNLPETEQGVKNETDSFQVNATDYNSGDTLSYEVTSTTCSFNVNIDTAGLVTWTCGNVESCTADITVTDDGSPLMSVSNVLTIECTNSLPTISSTPDANGEEHTEYVYDVVCADPDGDTLTLTVGTSDTCGGSIVDNGDGTGSYSFTPGESDGGSSCNLHVECSDGLANEIQNDSVAIAETNTSPMILGLPATESVIWGMNGSYQVSATDADEPQNILSWSVVSNTCSFTPVIDSSGLVSWSCGVVETCEATIGVQDNGTPSLNVSGVLTIQCTNNPPEFTTTAPTSATEHVEYSYSVACTDPDGDTLSLAVSPSDTCGGSLSGSGGSAIYTFIPGEDLGSSTCTLGVSCNDSQSTILQEYTISVTETNESPVITNLPSTQTTQWLNSGSFTATAYDSDLPTQILSWSLESSTCSFLPAIDGSTGEINWSCGQPENCQVAVQVTDSFGQTNEQQLSIQCVNASTPVIDSTPLDDVVAGDVYSYSVSCNDEDLDPLTITIGAGDTCGGTLVSNTGNSAIYEFSTPLVSSDATCTMDLVCSDTISEYSQVSDISIYYQYAKIAGGGSHTCGIKEDGTLWCWGRNNQGQLGTGDNEDRLEETQIGTDTDWRDITAGSNHTCAIRDDFSAWCWGDNFSGQLGIGNYLDQFVPVELIVPGSWDNLSAGSRHTCGIKIDGTTWCWGTNTSGQLGLGHNFSRNTPNQVGTQTNAYIITCGGNHTCAIKSDGRTWCWGDNYYGQLGTGDNSDRDTPVQIGSKTDAMTIAAGGSHTCAIKTSGETFCWGNNFGGQLGIGSSSNQNTPQLLSSTFTRIFAGGSHTCAVTSGHNLYCWGANSDGQVGNYSTSNQYVPEYIGTSYDILVSLGGQHSCAINLDGTTQCWGYNLYGQLGIGSTTNQNHPINIQ